VVCLLPSGKMTPLPVPLKLRLPLMVCPVVKVLAKASCGTFVVSKLRVTLPLVPPPVRSLPAVTPVMVPAPGNVCPAEKVNVLLPVNLTSFPCGDDAPEQNRSLIVPEGFVVFFPAGSAFH